MAGTAQLLIDIVGDANVLTDGEIADDYTHDEALTAEHRAPAAVVKPASTAEVAAVLRVANELGVPVTARGSGTGLSGACVAAPGGLLLSLERMSSILEVDTENHVAVVQPGVTLDELDDAIAPHGLVYPVYPGENSASLGGNVATNAGGMRAVKHGVTRHHVLGLEAVLATGEVIRAGGRFVKATSGYDLTQLLIGSEGTLAVVTEITLKLHPRLAHQATVLAPFRTLGEVTAAVPRIVDSAVQPLILEYVDQLAMAATTADVGLDLGIPEEVRDAALAYLFVVVEGSRADRLDEDVLAVSGLLLELGAIDAYVLPPHAGAQLLEAREKAFWMAKQAGADDIIDVVVPRASIPDYLASVSALAAEHGAIVAGAGHAGDGNVHLAVFQPDPEARSRLLRGIFETGMALGGAISAEHGIGTEKMPYFLQLEDPVKLDLMRRIKAAFDPKGILNPGTLLG
ncbi:MAG: FAD-binding oxidoreductase [Acidimicrobiales bacterium]|nr:FAD-binding oxidoreductase [Acidimicrobiales bacterium]